MTGRAQTDCTNEWRARAARLVQRTVALPDDAALLTRTPPGGGWAAARVLEHLVLATGSYLVAMRHAMRRPAAAPPNPVWRPSLSGRLLAWSMTSKGRFRAPGGWTPDVAPRPHVVNAWIEQLRELDALLDQAATVPWNRVRFRSPVTALLRLNLGDGFLVTVVHAERHFGQIDRVLAAVRS